MTDMTDTPMKRGRPARPDSQNLVMFSARIDESLCEYVREVAHKTRKSRQEIIGEALELFRAKYNLPVGNK